MRMIPRCLGPRMSLTQAVVQSVAMDSSDDGRDGAHEERMLTERAILESIQGDFIEPGVWCGGASICAKGFFATYGEIERRVFVADSFRGLPRPDAEKFPADKGDESTIR